MVCVFVGLGCINWVPQKHGKAKVKRIPRQGFAITALALLTVSLPARQVVTLEFLDHPLGIAESYEVNSLSADGSVVVGGYSIDGANYGFRWEGGAFSTLKDSMGFVPSSRWISPSGDIITGVLESSNFENYVWDFRQSADEDPVKESIWLGNPNAVSSCISDNNEILAGGLIDWGQDISQGCFWDNGNLNHLPYLSGSDNWSFVSGMSSDGSIMIGTSGIKDQHRNLVMWKDGLVTKLENPIGDGQTGLGNVFVSSDGNTIVSSTREYAGYWKYYWVRWVSGTPDIIRETNENNQARLIGMSGDGKQIVAVNGPALQAYLVSEEKDWVLESLDEMLDSHGVDREGFSLYDAKDISKDGSTIIGESYKFINQDEFVLRSFRLQILDLFGQYQITEGVAETGDWLGRVHASLDPWAWCEDAPCWQYFPEETTIAEKGWVYPLEHDDLQIVRIEGTDWGYSFALNKWLYMTEHGWVYMM